MPDHCGRCIDVMPRSFFSVSAPFTPLCLHALLVSPVLRNPLGVPNGMLAVLSMVSVPYVCVCVTAYICMNEK